MFDFVLRLFVSSAIAPRSNLPDSPPNSRLTEKRGSIWLSSTAKDARKREARDRREKAISDRLSRYALIPASEIFTLQPEWSPRGLSEDAANAIREKHGPNVYNTEQHQTAFKLLMSASINSFNILLLFLAIISITTSDKATFTIMILMVILSTSLRFWQEMKSRSKTAALINSVTTRVRVLRAAQSANSVPTSVEVEVDRKAIVPGDVLAVASGDVFAGDCVLLSASSLSVSHASLTGELMPIDKYVRLLRAPSQYAFNILESENICLAGTSVTVGSGHALVLSTGADTYMASIAKELAKRRPINTMQMGIRKVSLMLLVFMLVMAPIVLIIQGVVSHDWKSALLFTIAVAVGITPEMLPMIVASNLALSAVRVAKKKVIVKRLDSIQNLGAVSILCSDKTGTLTVDSVHVSVSATDFGVKSDLPVKLAYINSTMQTGTRSPIDTALVNHMQENLGTEGFEDIKLDTFVKLGEIPFDSARRLLSVLVSRCRNEDGYDPAEALLITKGAVEEVLDRCARVFTHSQTISEGKIVPLPPVQPNILDFRPSPSSSLPLTADERSRILSTAERLNKDGLRLIAVGCKLSSFKPPSSGSENVPLYPEDEEDLTFIGFIGFLDPPKEGAKEAIDKLKGLHVQVRILTGDTPAVAAKVARDLGVLSPHWSTSTISHSAQKVDREPHLSLEMEEKIDEKDLIVTGPQLAALSNSEDKATLMEVIERGIIFAKLSPYQKLEVVEILRSGRSWSGGRRAVAFLGDGVNDALAIRGADVGISVDSGTEIAKEAADVILLEKSLNVVADGVVQGRITFINTIKYIKMAASSNFGNVFSVLVASAWLPYQPMLPIQLLTQNLLYDFSQGSIPWDNVDPEYLETPKTWDVTSIVRFVLCMGPLSSPFDIITFSINWFKFGIRSLDSPFVHRAQVHWFIEGSLTQLFIIHYLRTPKIPFIQARASSIVVVVTTGIAAIAMAIPWIPKVHEALQFETPEPEFYGLLVALIVTYALLVQMGKMIYIKVFNDWI